MTIIREYVHRTFGNIGKVTMEAKCEEVKINGKVIPAASVEYLLNFSLQSLQDAYAGAKTEAEATSMFEKKLKALVEGSIGVRTGTSVSDETRIARNMIRKALKSKMGADSPEWKEFTGLSDADQNAKLDKLFEKNRDKLMPAVTMEVEALAAERARKARLAKSTDGLDL